MTEKNIQLSDKDLKELLALGSGPELAYDRSKTVVNLIVEQAGKTPDAVAVVDEEGQMTYRELDEQSNCLAHWLVEAKGVAANDFVAVMLPRVKEFAVAVLGIWKAGAAYVPIDLEYPEERKNFVLEDSCAKAVINAESYPSSLGSMPSVYRESVNLSSPEGLAYMIYTSGSTGKPKGVMIGQDGLLNYVQSTIIINGILPSDRVSAYRSFAFDSHIEEFYPSLSVGATVFIIPEKKRKDLSAIKDFLDSNKISVAYFTTALAALVYNTFTLHARFIGAVGEKLRGVIGGKNGVRILNTYGPTECTDHISTFWLKDGKEYGDIPIGRPLHNGTVMIVDSQFRLVPRGQIGELCFSSVQIARGYWHQEELTAEKFVDCPYIPGTKMYRTGDLCRWNEDGQLEYIGRKDNQVKLRGFRIELGDIESVASRLAGVRQVVAIVRKELIVLYWCGDATEEEMREHLKGLLPEYMWPSAYLHLDEMPLNSNGKIDRKHMPEPEVVQSGHIAPETERERFVFDKVKDLIGTDNFGVTDNLSLLGLDSLKAMKLLVEIPEKWGIKISDIIGGKTIREILCRERDVLWLRNEYNPSRKTVAVVHGLIGETDLAVLEDELSGIFNVLVIEYIHDTLLSRKEAGSLISEDGYNEFIRLYIQRLEEVLPEGCVLSLLVGFSMGGSMAYDIACAWKGMTGQEPVVVMGDTDLSYLLKAGDSPCEADSWQQQLLAIRRSKKTVETYSGRVIMLNAVKCQLNEEVKSRLKGGLLYDVARWLYWHLHIRDRVSIGKGVPKIGFIASNHRRESQENLSEWRRYKPDIEIINIDTNHEGLFRDKDLISQHAKLIEREVSHNKQTRI